MTLDYYHEATPALLALSPIRKQRAVIDPDIKQDTNAEAA